MPLHACPLEVLYDVPILKHKLRARIAEDVHPPFLAEILEKRMGDNVPRFAEVVMDVIVESRDLFREDRRKVIAKFTNQFVSQQP